MSRKSEPGRLRSAARAIGREIKFGTDFYFLSRGVFYGRKPGAFLDYKSARGYEKYGFEVISVMDSKGEKKGDIIALRKNTVEKVIEQRGIPQIPEIQKDINTLLEKLKDKSVAQALADVMLDPNTGRARTQELPKSPAEIATEGLLLGYNLCCVEYYVYTRELGRTENSREGLHPRGEIFCPDCTKLTPISDRKKS